MSRSDDTKQRLLEALEASLGVVTTACKKAGVGRTIFYNYLATDVEFRRAVQDVQNVAIDFAESKLHELIMNGSAPATIFYLKTKGRDRGYVERHEVTNVDREPFIVKVIDGFTGGDQD
jgi:hypothetical protein